MGVELDLSGSRALITGAGQGVGRTIARWFAAAGAEVLVNDFVGERADAVAAEIAAEGGRSAAAPFDVTDYDAVVATIGAHGGVDILVNNAGNAGTAGWAGLATLVETEPADWEAYLRVNLYGVMYCVRAALPAMIEKGSGRIITIVSDAARTGESHMAAYAGAKAGAAGFCRSVAHEVGRYGITVNNIALGTMKTPVSEDMWNDPTNPRAKELMKKYVIRRPGEPEDAAGLALYLASPMASWITGQTYPLNGGFSFAI
jgi:3-oxoacyl-[acyl-carrier protein] reductase